MRRRILIVRSAAAGAAAALPATAVIAQPKSVVWRLLSSYPKSMDVLFGASTMLSERVSQLTDARFDIRVYAAEETGNPLQALDGVISGAVEACHGQSGMWADKPQAHIFGGAAPFGLTARQQTAWIHYGGGLKLLRDFYGELNTINFPGINTGTQMGGWFRRAVDSVDDLKGMRMWISGFAGEVFSKLGVIPRPLPAADVYRALAMKTIDAVSSNGPHDDEKLGLFRVAKNYYAAGSLGGGANASFFVNKESFLALPKQYQSAFEVATNEANFLATARYDTLNAFATRRLVSKGASIQTFPRGVLQAAYKASEGLLDMEAERNPDFKKLLESWRTFRESQALWFGTSELAFVNSSSSKHVRR